MIHWPPLGKSLTIVLACAAGYCGHRARGAESAATLRVATFVAEITPPKGEPLVGGEGPPVATIEHPLLAKGLVLQDAKGTYVLCALDLCTVSNQSYAGFRRRIAEAAGTVPGHVALHEVQQHTAPSIDVSVQRLLDSQPQPPQFGSAKYAEQATAATTASVREAMRHLRRATHLGLGSAEVERVASARRVPAADGSIIARHSRVRDPSLQDLPEGLIDPKLRTVAFYDGDVPLVYLHFYATHPQTWFRDQRVSYDMPGIARQRLEQETKVPQIYFSGCGGNIVVGKYNDGTPAARDALAGRLYEGIVRSTRNIRREPVSPIQWKTATLRLPPRSDEPFTEATARRLLADASETELTRIKAAHTLVWRDRFEAGTPVEVACLHMGSLRMLSLPGDTFVEYQLWAQQQCPDKFVAVAGFGDFGMGYVCTDQAYRDRGGYEQTATVIAPCERPLKQAIAEVLGVKPGP